MITSANDSTAMQIIMNSQYREFPETLLILELCRAAARADGRKIGESLRACAKVKARQAKNRNLFNTLTEMSRSQFPEVQKMIRSLAVMQIPAYKSFLAEVRAQGVEMFSEKFGGGTLLSNMVKETAKEFAAQLRKGVQS